MPTHDWWKPPWTPGGDNDPDVAWEPETTAWQPDTDADSSGMADAAEVVDEELGQVRSRQRVRDLAEVFTHQREIDAMLDQITDAFDELDIKFLEPACGSGNFCVEILRRKLRLVIKSACANQEHYEHRLLRAAASLYGVDISPENVTETRSRLAHVILDHYQTDANTSEPTAAFLNALVAILGSNIVRGDALADAAEIELCDWQPRPGGRFRRVWTNALVPEAERDLFWTERVQDTEPVHYRDLGDAVDDQAAAPGGRR